MNTGPPLHLEDAEVFEALNLTHMPADVHTQSSVNSSRPQSASGNHSRLPTEPSANGQSLHSDWPVDWPDANLTSNQSFLSFVEFAVRQALQAYRTSTGHDDIQVGLCHCISISALTAA